MHAALLTAFRPAGFSRRERLKPSQQLPHCCRGLPLDHRAIGPATELLLRREQSRESRAETECGLSRVLRPQGLPVDIRASSITDSADAAPGASAHHAGE